MKKTRKFKKSLKYIEKKNRTIFFVDFFHLLMGVLLANSLIFMDCSTGVLGGNFYFKGQVLNKKCILLGILHVL